MNGEPQRPDGFAGLLVVERRRRGFSQETLAERAGLGVRTVRDLERGRVTRPRAGTVALLADALGLTGFARDAFAAAGDGGRAVGRTPTLPDPLSPLVGREAGLAALVDGWTARSRLLLTGLGGVGKTRLALALGRQVEPGHRDGALFLDLRATRTPMSPAELVRRVLHAWGADTEGGDDEESATARLVAFTADRDLLLLLDDVADAAQLRPVFAPGVRAGVVATSRQPLLGLEDVTVVPVEPLGTGDGVVLLGRFSGRPGLEADPGAAEVAALCDGMPLALRVAGTRLATRPRWRPADLARRLRDERGRLDLLSVADLDVRATIGAGLASVSPAARSALRRLTVPASSHLPRFLVEALVGTDEPGHDRLDHLLDELVEAGLLDALGTGPDGVERFHLHDLVRLVAAESTADPTADPSGSAAGLTAATERAVAAVTAVARVVDERLREQGINPAGPAWTAWVAAHRVAGPAAPVPSVRPAVAGATGDDVLTAAGDLVELYPVATGLLRHGWDAGAVATTWPLAVALASYQDRAGLVADWLDGHERALACLTEVVATPGPGGAIDPRAVLIVRTGLAAARLARGEMREAVEAYEAAATAARSLGDATAAVHAEAMAAVAVRYGGDGPEAGRRLRAILASTDEPAAGGGRTTADDDTLTTIRCEIASSLRDEGRSAEAYALLSAVTADRTATTAAGLTRRARTLVDLALSRLDLGHAEAAQADLREALAVFRHYRWVAWEAATLRALSRSLRLAGSTAAAAAAAEACLAAFTRLGDRRWQGWARLELAHVHLAAADPSAADRDLVAAESLLTDVRDVRGLSAVLEVRGLLGRRDRDGPGT